MSIARLKLRCADPAALLAFYVGAFGAEAEMGGFRLGAERVALAPAADPSPELFASNETGFQHFALVVADMGVAYARLCAAAGWSPISLEGPERLPAASGGATAFKFRDPELHPLELLQFAEPPPVWRARFAAAPARVFHGIDHTGLTVADVGASVTFWAAQGFAAVHRQLNRGPEQARLDGFAAPEAQVEIVSLSPADGSRPGIELLGYRGPAALSRPAADASTAATAIVLPGAAPGRDPDGHRLQPS